MKPYFDFDRCFGYLCVSCLWSLAFMRRAKMARLPFRCLALPEEMQWPDFSVCCHFLEAFPAGTALFLSGYPDAPGTAAPGEAGRAQIKMDDADERNMEC